MDSLLRLLLQLRSSKPSKNEANHVERSNSFTVQMSPTFYQHRHRQNEAKAALPLQAETVETPSVDTLNRQNVNYLFSAVIGSGSRPTCLKMLQEPLKDVYLSYVSGQRSSTPCVIENLSHGLRFRYVNSHDHTSVDIFNEFHTIAYWAAVRCVVINSSLSTSGLQIGFFPFTESGQCVIQEYSTEGFLQIDEHHADLMQNNHPPLFACVMRDAVTSALQCHVFLCADSKQAISLAAKLYESLKANLSNKLELQNDQNNENYQLTTSEPLKGNVAITDECQLNGQVKSSDQLHAHHAPAKRKYSTIVCASCKQKPKVGNRRSTSFSQFLSRLRRLAVNKNNESDEPLQRRLSSHKKSFRHQYPVPAPRTRSKQLNEKCFLDAQKDDCDAGYHSIPPREIGHKLQFTNISMATPPWMKELVDGDSKNNNNNRCSWRKKREVIPSLKRSSYLLGNSSKSLGSFASEKSCNNYYFEGGFSDNGSAYEEIEEPEAFESKLCSVVDEANFSSSEDEEDNLTEVDSLESSSSWRRFQHSKVNNNIRQLQIETINRMLDLTPRKNKTRSLSDLFFKGNGNFIKQNDGSQGQKFRSGAKTTPDEDEESPLKIENHENYVKKDAEIFSTLKEILKPVRPPRNSDLQLLKNRISVNKPFVELQLSESELMENDKRLSDECHWGWASFLP